MKTVAPWFLRIEWSNMLTSGSALLASVWDGIMSLPNQWQMHVGWQCSSPDQLIQVRVKTETWRGSEQFRQCKYSLGWMKSGFTSLSHHKQCAPVQRYTVTQSRSYTWVEVLKTGLGLNSSQDQVHDKTKTMKLLEKDLKHCGVEGAVKVSRVCLFLFSHFPFPLL